MDVEFNFFILVYTSLFVRLIDVSLYQTPNILTYGFPGFCLTNRTAYSRLSSGTLAPVVPATPFLVRLHLRSMH